VCANGMNYASSCYAGNAGICEGITEGPCPCICGARPEHAPVCAYGKTFYNRCEAECAGFTATSPCKPVPTCLTCEASDPVCAYGVDYECSSAALCVAGISEGDIATGACPPYISSLGNAEVSVTVVAMAADEAAAQELGNGACKNLVTAKLTCVAVVTKATTRRRLTQNTPWVIVITVSTNDALTFSAAALAGLVGELGTGAITADVKAYVVQYFQNTAAGATTFTVEVTCASGSNPVNDVCGPSLSGTLSGTGTGTRFVGSVQLYVITGNVSQSMMEVV
jgi:hypothetical protein